MIAVCFSGKPFKITAIQVYAPATDPEEVEAERFSEDLQGLLELTANKMSFSSSGIGMQKVGSQEIPRITGKFNLGAQSEAGQKTAEFCQENALVIANTIFQQHKR